MPWLVRMLALVAFALSVFLFWTSVTGDSAVGCNAFAEFDCDAALGSRWASWFGLPVAAGGVACYAAALAGSFLARRTGPDGSLGWRLLEAVVPLAIGAGVWFTIVQAAFLGSWCVYCLATHMCGVGMAIAYAVWRRSAATTDSGPVAVGLSGDGFVPAVAATGPPTLGLPTIGGVLGVVALALGQMVGAPPAAVAEFEAQLDTEFTFATEDEPASPRPEPIPSEPLPAAEKPMEPTTPLRKANGSRPLSLLGGQLKIDAYDHAILGSPEAPHIVVEMMDYACPHCREFHETLTEAIARFEGQVGVLVMPVPGEISCNKYVTKARKKSDGACYAARLSIAVSRLEPERFPRFHHWMLQAERIPSRTAALIEARRHADGDDLSQAIRDTDGIIAGRIKQYVELAGALSKMGKFGLPSQILGDRVMSGPAESLDALCESWAEAFDLELPTAELPF